MTLQHIHNNKYSNTNTNNDGNARYQERGLSQRLITDTINHVVGSVLSIAVASQAG